MVVPFDLEFSKATSLGRAAACRRRPHNLSPSGLSPPGLNSTRADSVSFLKYLFKRSRSCSRPRHNHAFTAVCLKFSTSAVSAVEEPSMSRSTKTVRKIGTALLGPWLGCLVIQTPCRVAQDREPNRRPPSEACLHLP